MECRSADLMGVLCQSGWWEFRGRGLCVKQLWFIDLKARRFQRWLWRREVDKRNRDLGFVDGYVLR